MTRIFPNGPPRLTLELLQEPPVSVQAADPVPVQNSDVLEPDFLTRWSLYQLAKENEEL